MCKYCNSKKQEVPIDNDSTIGYSEYTKKWEISVFAQDEYGDPYEHIIYINYCPFCGRKLD